MSFFDTARCYSDSEQKLGKAFGENWSGISIVSKTMAKTGEVLQAELAQSLEALQTDHIDCISCTTRPFVHSPAMAVVFMRRS